MIYDTMDLNTPLDDYSIDFQKRRKIKKMCINCFNLDFCHKDGLRSVAYRMDCFKNDWKNKQELKEAKDNGK